MKNFAIIINFEEKQRNLCKLLNIKTDVRVKFQIQPNEKGMLIFSTSLLSGATRTLEP